MKNEKRVALTLSFIVFWSISLGGTAAGQDKSSEPQQEIPKEQIPVEERDQGDSFIEE